MLALAELFIWLALSIYQAVRQWLAFGRLTLKRLRRPASLAAVPPVQWLYGGSSPRRRRGGPGPSVLGDCVDCLRARVLACVYVSLVVI